MTTRNGDLVVYDLEPQGSSVTLGTLLFHRVYDGALGATNSIVIDDSQSDNGVDLEFVPTTVSGYLVARAPMTSASGSAGGPRFVDPRLAPRRPAG